METKTKQQVTYDLCGLTPQAALWLKQICQNEIHADESDYDRIMREQFWNSLPDIQTLSMQCHG